MFTNNYSRKRLFILLLSLLLLLTTIQCAHQTTIVKHEKSYSIGEEIQTNVGNVMTRNVSGTFIMSKRYIGTGGYGEENWAYYEEPTGDSFKQELIYTGRSGSTIFISYREYRRDIARPAFYQDLRYDLEERDIIGFRDKRIRVLEATSEYIKFIVLNE